MHMPIYRPVYVAGTDVRPIEMVNHLDSSQIQPSALINTNAPVEMLETPAFFKSQYSML
jgi:hypothetical protein